MSEEEKRKRSEYKKRRAKWKGIQLGVIIFVTLVALIMSVTYYQLNKAYYISYTENGLVDYKVYLKENGFYDEEYLGSGQAYVASLIDSVKADFVYDLAMEAGNVSYEYSYMIDTQLLIIDGRTGSALYSPVYETLPAVKISESNRDHLRINECVDIDYVHYNEIAQSFIDIYDLDEAKCHLSVRMHISVLSVCEDFEADNTNEYVVALNIPLTSKTLDIQMTSSVPEAENKILACDRVVNKDMFKLAGIIAVALDIVLIIIFATFIYTTRNTDINYTIRVQRLVSAYKSFIQKINNRFDTTGYQVLYVDTFNEMLEIRDTIQSPILMNENPDQTRTSFLIPTNTKILYVFDIKVDNYDELYADSLPEGAITFEYNFDEPEATDEAADAPAPEDASDACVTDEPEAKAEAPIEEATEAVTEASEAEASEAEASEAEASEAEASEAEVSEAEEPAAEEQAEATAEEEPSDEHNESVHEGDVHISEELLASIEAEGTEDFRIVNGEVVHIRYRTSFSSRLIQAKEKVQDYYTALKNILLSYKGVKGRVSWAFESFNKGRTPCAKLNVKGSAVLVYLALNPDEYNADKYRFVNVGDKPKLSDVPMLIKVKSDRSLKYATELIAEVMRKNEIQQEKIPEVSYRMPYETNDELAERGLVKIILPAGIVIDENTVIKKLNVSELLRDMRGSAAKEETLVEESAPSEAEPDFDEHNESVHEGEVHISEELLASIEAEGAEDFRIVNGEVVHIRYRTSFSSRLIQAKEKVQDYYTALKNILLSYKGVKGRVSWAFESFNKGRTPCAKLNVKGSAVLVYLALNPDEYNADKYRFVNVGDKPKLSDVPMLIKVKSDRSLKYATELIAEVMRKNEIQQEKIPEVSYRMPYETNEELADRGLVKVLLPAGIVIDETTVIKKLNISELMKEMKSSDDKK